MIAPTLDDFPIAGAKLVYITVEDRRTGRPIRVGQFPHAPRWDAVPLLTRCEATLTIGHVGEEGESVERCTRETGHRGPHVVHVRAGQPVLAWLIDPRTATA